MESSYGVTRSGLRRMPLDGLRFYMIVRSSIMHDSAVFFDPSHRRWWWVKRIGTLLGLVSVLIVSAWLVSLFTVPLLKPFPGITEAIRRSLRVPPHRQARAQYILQRDRERLLASHSKASKSRRGPEAKSPLRTSQTGNSIWAAGFAP